jgi:hypothetical protein
MVSICPKVFFVSTLSDDKEIKFRATFRKAMPKLALLRYNRTEADRVSFMILTATPTTEILDEVYKIVGFTRQNHQVLYIRKALNRPNIFFAIKWKTTFEVSSLIHYYLTLFIRKDELTLPQEDMLPFSYTQTLKTRVSQLYIVVPLPCLTALLVI